MDAYAATRVVFSRIQNLDPENASKIMGLLLIQDHGEKEMIRLAFGPETLVHSVILKARKELGLHGQIPKSPSLSSSSPSTPLSPSPFLSRQNSSSRVINGGFNLPSPLSIPNSSAASWSNFSHVQNQDELFSPNHSSLPVGSSSSNSSSLPLYGGNTSDMMDEFQLQDQLSFLNDNNSPALGGHSSHKDMFYQQPDLASSPTGIVDNMLHPYNWGGGSVHRRSSSVSDVCFGSDDPSGGGFGWKPCMYYARGYCKNGTTCRFLHGDSMVGADGVLVGSPNKIDLLDQCPEMVRSRTAQQQSLAAASQLMASSLPYSPKGMSFILQQQQNDSQRAASPLMMNEDLHKFGRSRLDRNEMMNPASRQIYLTFPADSTFREEDVTNYFSIYGPVEDVRIPYQQKRMFGFVTFVYPETVKIILAKGNPHFVCDARVLAKPYKEKGKVADKKQPPQHQMERGEFSPCGTPTGMESRDPYDLQLGSRMFHNARDMLWRRKLEEQADLQQALELQSRRLMNLQLLDIKKHHHLRTLSAGSPVVSPSQSPNLFNQNIVLPSLHSNPEVPEESPYGSNVVNASNNADQNWQKAVNVAAGKEGTDKFGNGHFKESQTNKEIDLQENLEHNLPDSLFASPTKPSSEFLSAFSNSNGNAEKEPTTAVTTSPSAVSGNSDNSSILPASSPLEVSAFKSFNCQLPRFSSSHGGAIGMSGGTGGPTCPVGI